MSLLFVRWVEKASTFFIDQPSQIKALQAYIPTVQGLLTTKHEGEPTAAEWFNKYIKVISQDRRATTSRFNSYLNSFVLFIE